VGDRELQFFSGTARGSVVPGFSYRSGAWLPGAVRQPRYVPQAKVFRA
jgi:glutamine amidotransferase-like uncharacterized protein